MKPNDLIPPGWVAVDPDLPVAELADGTFEARLRREGEHSIHVCVRNTAPTRALAEAIVAAERYDASKGTPLGCLSLGCFVKIDPEGQPDDVREGEVIAIDESDPKHPIVKIRLGAED